MNTVNSSFQQAQLAQAAYAVGFVKGMSGQSNEDYLGLLTDEDVGMSDAQARAFADTYTVVEQFNDPESGFSATIFQETNTGQESNTGKIYFAIRGTEGLNLT
ncbi:MAG: hypothetical protein WCH04_13415, partial [Gammaproteobacteria bacterium]